jgi:hypothetical protein
VSLNGRTQLLTGSVSAIADLLFQELAAGLRFATCSRCFRLAALAIVRRREGLLRLTV